MAVRYRADRAAEGQEVWIALELKVRVAKAEPSKSGRLEAEEQEAQWEEALAKMERMESTPAEREEEAGEPITLAQAEPGAMVERQEAVAVEYLWLKMAGPITGIAGPDHSLINLPRDFTATGSSLHEFDLTRFLAMATYFSLISEPMKLCPSLLAALRVTPEPAKGS